MKKNLGLSDRIFRIILAIGFAALYFTHTVTGAYGIGLLIAGAISLLTSFIGTCPLYMLFGVSTCPFKHSKIN